MPSLADLGPNEHHIRQAALIDVDSLNIEGDLRVSKDPGRGHSEVNVA